MASNYPMDDDDNFESNQQTNVPGEEQNNLEEQSRNQVPTAGDDIQQLYAQGHHYYTQDMDFYERVVKNYRFSDQYNDASARVKRPKPLFDINHEKFCANKLTREQLARQNYKYINHNPEEPYPDQFQGTHALVEVYNEFGKLYLNPFRKTPLLVGQRYQSDYPIDESITRYVPPTFPDQASRDEMQRLYDQGQHYYSQDMDFYERVTKRYGFAEEYNDPSGRTLRPKPMFTVDKDLLCPNTLTPEQIALQNQKYPTDPEEPYDEQFRRAYQNNVNQLPRVRLFAEQDYPGSDEDEDSTDGAMGPTYQDQISSDEGQQFYDEGQDYDSQGTDLYERFVEYFGLSGHRYFIIDTVQRAISPFNPADYMPDTNEGSSPSQPENDSQPEHDPGEMIRKMVDDLVEGAMREGIKEAVRRKGPEWNRLRKKRELQSYGL